MNFDKDLITVFAPIISSVITGIVTYAVTRTTASKDVISKREDFMDSQMKLLMETYQKDITSLRQEMAGLQEENTKLQNEVLRLKSKIIEMESDK